MGAYGIGIEQGTGVQKVSGIKQLIRDQLAHFNWET